LAVIECYKALGPNPKDFVGFVSNKTVDDLMAVLDTCDQARTQVLADDPQAGDPGSELATTEAQLRDSLLYVMHVIANGHFVDEFTTTDQKVVQDSVDEFTLSAVNAGASA